MRRKKVLHFFLLKTSFVRPIIIQFLEEYSHLCWGSWPGGPGGLQPRVQSERQGSGQKLLHLPWHEKGVPPEVRCGFFLNIKCCQVRRLCLHLEYSLSRGLGTIREQLIRKNGGSQESGFRSCHCPKKKFNGIFWGEISKETQSVVRRCQSPILCFDLYHC